MTSKTEKILKALNQQTPIGAVAGDGFYLPNHSGINSHPEVKSKLVPYTGANANVNLGNYTLTNEKIYTNHIGEVNSNHGVVFDNRAVYINGGAQNPFLDFFKVGGNASITFNLSDFRFEFGANLYADTLYIDHIGERTGSHGVVFDNNVTVPELTDSALTADYAVRATTAGKLTESVLRDNGSTTAMGTSPVTYAQLRMYKAYTSISAASNALFVEAFWGPGANDPTYCVRGAYYNAQKYGTYNATGTLAIRGMQCQTENAGTGTLTECAPLMAYHANTAAGTTGTVYNVLAMTPGVISGAVTNSYGLYIQSQKPAGVTSGYGIYQAGTSDENVFNGDLFFASDGSGLPYGAFYGSDVAWSQAAAQNTWYDIVDTDFTDSELNLVTHDGSGKLTVTKAGRYLVNYSVTVKSGTANTYIEVGIEKNDSGSALANGQAHSDVVTANKYICISGTGIFDLAASDYIELSIRTTDAGNPTLTVDDANVTILHVGGT